MFEFATATRIVFGRGSVTEAVNAARGRVLVVAGSQAAPILDSGLDCVLFHLTGEPTIDEIRRGTLLGKEEACETVIGIGGGSVIDTGKAISAMMTNSGNPLDYLEVIGRGLPLQNPPAPFIAIPTTAGTGSEVTRNAVLASPEHKVKASLRSPLMLPCLAIVDPELTFGLPPALTASTGLDALTQLIEPFVSLKANLMSDLFCVEGMQRVARSLARAYQDDAPDARVDMSFASLLGGLSLANSGLGVIHGFAAPIGGMFDAPHGAVCAALLPYGIAANIAAARAQGIQNTIDRYARIAALLTGLEECEPEDCLNWLYGLYEILNVPRLRTYGVTPAHIPEVVGKAANASSMKANPIQLTIEELTNVLGEAL